MTKLGFGSSPVPTKIFIAKEQNSLWHFWNQRIEIIESSSITCYLKSIYQKEVKNDFGTSQKLVVNIEADKPYEIYSGIDTWFSKSILLTLSAASDKELTRIITIEPYSRNNNKVIFARIYNWQGVQIKSAWEWRNEKGEKRKPDYQQIFSELKKKIENMKQSNTEF